MATYHIDQIDQKILSFLINNARMPFLEIARECGVSGAAIHQRVKRLEANGVISGSRLMVKPQALGLNVCAFISVTLSEANKYPEVVSNLKKIAEIVECHFVTGKAALLVKVYCFDNDHLMEILLNTMHCVSKSSRMVVMPLICFPTRSATEQVHGVMSRVLFAIRRVGEERKRIPTWNALLRER